MSEEMRVEAMELCVTACEKFASNNEVSLVSCRRMEVRNSTTVKMLQKYNCSLIICVNTVSFRSVINEEQCTSFDLTL
jgi:hypothetical protein